MVKNPHKNAIDAGSILVGEADPTCHEATKFSAAATVVCSRARAAAKRSDATTKGPA